MNIIRTNLVFKSIGIAETPLKRDSKKKESELRGIKNVEVGREREEAKKREKKRTAAGRELEAGVQEAKRQAERKGAAT